MGPKGGGECEAMPPFENNLLRALRADDAALLLPDLECWNGLAGDVIYDPGDMVRHAYFPCRSSTISYSVLLDDGRAITTAMIGREGAIGGIVSQGKLPAYARAEVQFAGPFLRVDLVRLEEAKARSLTLQHLFDRYADCLMAQVFQAVSCNAAHTIEQRVARWLCAAMDRIGSPEIPLTHEQLATMLGVGRSYISRVIGSLKARKIVATLRGGMVITDPAQLEHVACTCNASVRRHFHEVLSGVYPAELRSPQASS